MAGRTTTPGGSSLNTARAVNHVLKQNNGGKVAFFGCIGNDEAGQTLVDALELVEISAVFARTEETGTG